ncbi:GyrI-like domain-containing protein [Kitasatospora sp. NPDC097605]|uniref:AraC family transcriptional regulator n=1 Tax=Kitasatospora sp. NPDC097605 TaxID=3157226 RepID=UPI0033265B43
MAHRADGQQFQKCISKALKGIFIRCYRSLRAIRTENEEMFTLEDMPESRIAYLRRVGPYGAANAVHMEKLKSWAAERDLLRTDTAVLGIARDDPARTPPHACRYDTCLLVSDDTDLQDPEIGESRLTGGRHAVLTVAHTSEALAEAWSGLFGDLAAQGFAFDAARPVLERYRPSLLARHLCEICVPVH